MNAAELLTHLTEKQIDSLYRAARNLPADKLSWQPTPESRSALDQLQEIATAGDMFGEVHKTRKMEWDQEAFGRWVAERSKITDLDELERRTRAAVKRLSADLASLDPADLSLSVEMPFPGEFTLADIYAYYYWNMGYHEGQIYYIGTLIAGE